MPSPSSGDGRYGAAARRLELLDQYTSPDDLEALRNAAPLTEQYTITLWRTRGIDDTDG